MSKYSPQDTIEPNTSPDSWEVLDDGDASFWDEFFKIEDVLCATDELDPPSFSITVQNHQTGEVRTYQNIYLKSSRRKIVV